jgi:hypothetical protein
VPLACGGPDAVSNVRWQTIADARAKDVWERVRGLIAPEPIGKVLFTSRRDCTTIALMASMASFWCWLTGHATVVFVGLTTVATGFIAGFTFALRNSTERLWAATRASVDAIVNNERAWVGTVTVACDPPLAANASIRAWVHIKNRGRSPALDMRARFEGYILDKGSQPQRPDVTKTTSKPLFPDVDDFYRVFHGQVLSAADYNGIVSGTRIAWLIGRVEYLDSQGGSKHHTNVTTRWDCELPAFIPEGDNDAT